MVPAESAKAAMDGIAGLPQSVLWSIVTDMLMSSHFGRLPVEKFRLDDP